jgi:hypothetical protein
VGCRDRAHTALSENHRYRRWQVENTKTHATEIVFFNLNAIPPGAK